MERLPRNRFQVLLSLWRPSATPLGVGVAVVGLYLALSAFEPNRLAFFFPADELAALPVGGATIWACLWTMAAATVVFPFLKSAFLFRTILFVKGASLLLYFGMGTSLSKIDCFLLLQFLAEVSLYEAFFLNFVLSVLYLVACCLVLASVELGLQGGPQHWEVFLLSTLTVNAPLWATGLICSVLFGLLVYYRERCIALNDRMTQRAEVIERLTAANMGYQVFAVESSEASQLEERQRITRELHDIIGYTFTNNLMMMEAALTKIRKEPERVSYLIDLARENAKIGYEKIREALYILRAQETPNTPSFEKFQKLTEVFRVATEVSVHLDYGNLERELPEQVESFFYSFIQESLTNAFLHGGASQVLVRFYRSDEGVDAVVSDNGVGAITIKEGIGLKGMKERATKLSGRIEVRRLKRGLEMFASVPLPRPN